MKNKILNEITSFCNECRSKECCPEEECILYKIEQIVIKPKKENKKNEQNINRRTNNDNNYFKSRI